MSGTTCIIPVYNEAQRIGKIIQKLLTIPGISRIICVDESSDGSVAEIKRFPQVHLMHFPKRLGKTEAVRRGLRAVKSENVLLFDSDFTDFGVAQLARGVRLFENAPIDMLVFRQASNNGIHRWLKFDLALSGERLMRTRDLRSILARPAEGYQLELHINRFYESGGKVVYHLPLTGHNSFKILRRGFYKGMTDGIRMTCETIGYRGFSFYVTRVIGCTWPEWKD